MTRRTALGPIVAVLVTLSGCASAPRVAPPSAAQTAGDEVALAARVQALARQVEHERSGARRGALAAEAVETGRRCQLAAPGTPPCDYALAIALGMEVREHPSTLRSGLPRMAALLRRAAAADPALDHGGPDRVLALLLLRAPGWPLGPGDPEEGLAASRRAVAQDGAYAPNQLALAEALAASGDRAGARDAARRALALAEAALTLGEPDAEHWRLEATRLARAP